MPKRITENDTEPEVKVLKALLNRVLNPTRPLVVDTFFDMHTKSAVKNFQASNGLTDNGVVGPETWKKLFVRSGYLPDVTLAKIPSAVASPALPDTRGMTDDAKYDLYLRLLKSGSGDLTNALEALMLGERVILGLRVPTNTRVEKGAGVYDDRFVVLHQVGDAKSAVELDGNTEPSSRYEQGYQYATKIDGQDAGGDKRMDLGRLRPGVYHYCVNYHSTHRWILMPLEDIKLQRDTNHDGYFDDQDEVTNETALNSGKTVYFHKSSEIITGSAGCQTMKPAVFEEFWKVLEVRKQKKFWYVLVEMR